MKEIKLMNLSLTYFKGIEKFVIDLSGEDVRIFGDNATGKTTLYDSFLWLLFGKDSNNRADFAIKFLDENGKEINNIDHTVEATFEIDGQALTLKKIYKEKYRKKRGAPIAEFDGHETDHFVDGVPVKKKEYEEKVSSLVDEDIFKLITSPTFFNENLKWQDRRKVLIEILGDISFEDVLAFNSKLKDLPTILQNRTVDDHKKVIAARRAEINKELNMIPVRIDEINNSMPEEIDVSSIEKQVTEIEKSLDEHATQINSIKNGSAIIDLEALARALEHELKVIQDELEAEAKEKGFQVQAKIQEEQSNMAILKREKDDKKHGIERCHREITDIDNQLTSLRVDWNTVNARGFENNHNESTCPTCNQSLPAEDVQAAHEKALSEFNLKRANDLEAINAKGMDLSKSKVTANEQMESLMKSTEELTPKIETKEKAISKLETELNTLREEIKNARQNERYLSKIQEVEDVNQQVGSLKENAQVAVIDIEKEVVELRTKRTDLNAQIAQQAQAEANKKRIAELEEQQKDLATEFEKLEHELYLTEQFIQSKVKLLEEKINSKFKYARFNLFKTNINGGIEEICETTYEGVPFSSGLNNAARINVGIDIINTLTEHYGIRAPIFVDNSEAVTELIEVDAQLIRLIVPQSFDDYPEDIKSLLITTHGSYEGAKADWNKKYGQLRIENQVADVKEAI